MDVIYFYYYKFYTNIISDDQPHATTIFCLSLSESFVINISLELLTVKFFCYDLSKWIMLTTLLILIGINYVIFDKTGKGKRIVEKKPKIFGNNIMSIIITVLFFLGTASFMFWGPIYIKDMLENQCRE